MIENTPHNSGPYNSQPPLPAELGGLPLSPAQWLRLQADDEHTNLTAPADLPADGAERIAFDRELRKSCLRSMEQVKCPDAVRAAITSAMQRESLQLPVAHDHDGVIRTPMGDTRSPSFWSGARRYAAIAAVIAIAAVLIFRNTSFLPGGHVVPVQHASLLSAFVQNEHEKCSTLTDIQKHGLTAYSPSEAVKVCVALLGTDIERLAEKLEAMHHSGFEFVGLGKCDAPGPGPSMHLLFRESAALPKPSRVSLFIQADDEHTDIREAACYLTGCPKKKALMVVWRTDGVVHYLYACTPEALKIARIALDVPVEEHPL